MAVQMPKPGKAIQPAINRSKKAKQTVVLSGFVAPGEKGTVRLCPLSYDLGTYFVIPETAVKDFDEDSNGLVTLFVDPSTLVSAVSTASVPLIAVAMDNQPDGGGGTGSSCVDKWIEACKKDPMRSREFCDSAEARRQYEKFCKIFGDPKFSGGDFGIIA